MVATGILNHNRIPMASKSAIKWKQHPVHLAKVCKETYQSNLFADVMVVCGQKKFHCHRVLLSASSDFFDLILREHPAWIEPVIVVDNVDPGFMEAILNYLYTGVISINGEASNFLQVCSYFKIKGLMMYDVISGEEPEVEMEKATITTIRTEPDAVETEFCEEIIIEAEKPDKSEDEIEEEGFLDFLKYKSQAETSGTSAMVKKEPRPELGDKTTLVEQQVVLEQEIEIIAEEDFLDYFPPQSASSSPRRGARQPRVVRPSTSGTAEKRRRCSEGYTEAQLGEAVEAVCSGKLNLSKASQKYKVPKSVLWRKLQNRGDYVAHPVDTQRELARKALLGGESIQRVCKKFDVSMATLYRDKQKLLDEGKLLTGRRNKVDSDESMQQAMQACVGGMSQTEAARSFKVSKSTLWRKMRKM